MQEFLVQNNLLKGLAASSGFLVKALTVDEEFAFLQRIIQGTSGITYLFFALTTSKLFKYSTRLTF